MPSAASLACSASTAGGISPGWKTCCDADALASKQVIEDDRDGLTEEDGGAMNNKDPNIMIPST